MSLEKDLIRLARFINASGDTDFKIRQILYKIWRNMDTDNEYLNEDYNIHYQFHHLDDIDDKYDYRRRTNNKLNMLLMYCLEEYNNTKQNIDEKFVNDVYEKNKDKLSKDIDYYTNSFNKNNKDKEELYKIIKNEIMKILKDLENVAVITEPIHRFITNKTNKKKYNIKEIGQLVKIFDNEKEVDKKQKKDVIKFIHDRLNKIDDQSIKNIKEGCEKLKVICDLLDDNEEEKVKEKIKLLIKKIKEHIIKRYKIRKYKF